MLTRMVTLFLSLNSTLKKAFWKAWYHYFVGYFQTQDRIFMNYGYTVAGKTDDSVELSKIDESNRYPIQLYHHVASGADLENRDVLEIGCGRGGGAHFVMQYFNPTTLIAVDIAKSAIRFCQHNYVLPGLEFQQADAENLPFQDQSFDVVINVESSHCYGNMKTFLMEVFRVLRPGGAFLFADLRIGEVSEKLDSYLENGGFDLIHKLDITRNVIAALDLVHQQKIGMIQSRYPRFMQKSVGDFAGLKGGKIYQALKDGNGFYKSVVMRKPLQVNSLSHG